MYIMIDKSSDTCRYIRDVEDKLSLIYTCFRKILTNPPNRMAGEITKNFDKTQVYVFASNQSAE